MSVFATKGEEVKDLQTTKNDLIDENYKLREEISKAKTLEYAREALEDEKFVNIDKDEVVFVEIEKDDQPTTSK